MKGLLAGLASIVVALPAYAHGYHGNNHRYDGYHYYGRHSYCDYWGCYKYPKSYYRRRRHYDHYPSLFPPIKIIIK